MIKKISIGKLEILVLVAIILFLAYANFLSFNFSQNGRNISKLFQLQTYSNKTLLILTYSNVMQFQVSKLLLFSNFVDGWSRPSPNYTSKTILQFACRSKSLGLSHFKRHFKSGPEIFKWQKKQFIKSFLFKKIQLYKLNRSSSSSHQFLKQRFCQVDLHPPPRCDLSKQKYFLCSSK